MMKNMMALVANLFVSQIIVQKDWVFGFVRGSQRLTILQVMRWTG